MTLSAPLYLLLLVALPFLAWVGWPSRGPSRRREIISLALRLLIALLLILGLAGLELRRDSYLDHRDERVDGPGTWTDSVTGVVQESDLFGVSPTPDTKGSRTVFAAYAELAVPLIAPEMDIPLIRSLELQLAGRYEHYSDFSSIAKPKVAAAWDLFEGWRIRGSWAQGFRAPNLEQTNATIITRGNTRTDYILSLIHISEPTRPY